MDQGISEPEHGKEVVDGINAIDKRFMHQLMSTVQLPGSKRFDKQILINYCKQKKDVSLAKELQQHLSNDDRKHGVIDQGKDRKRASERKWTYREYHVQDNDYVA